MRRLRSIAVTGRRALAAGLTLAMMAGLGTSMMHAQDDAAGEAPADAAAIEEQSSWERSASFGLTLTEGNSQTTLLVANVRASRKFDPNEVSLGLDGTYGEDDGDKNNESIGAFGQYDRLFSERAFGFIRLEGIHDDIADVDYRLILSPGAGYYFIKEERTFLRGEAGPGAIQEKVGGESTGYITLRAAEQFEHKLNEKTKVWQSAEIIPQVDNFDNFLVTAEVGVETALTESMNLRVYLQDKYDNEPAEGRKENDLKLVAALGLTF